MTVAKKLIRVMNTAFRDGFQSVCGARVLTKDFMPAVAACRDAGITHLFSLTETPFPPEVAAAWGLTCSSYSMPDMAAPDLTRADAICEWLDALIQAGHAVAVHCKAGLGRTGTILAMYWMWTQSCDVSHQTAIQWVRSRSAGMIQSDSQVHFLSQYACARLGDATSMATPS